MASLFDWKTYPEGKARFCGDSGRINPEKIIQIYALELLDGREFFGEFGLEFEANRNFYAVEIISFGYFRKESVGIKSPKLIEYFSAEQKQAIEDLIRRLFLSNEAKPFPLSEI